jgi:AcrR family transcriptional regulator
LIHHFVSNRVLTTFPAPLHSETKKQTKRMVAQTIFPSRHTAMKTAQTSSDHGWRAAGFMDLGFDGASMNEIARAAGVSKGTLYVYFADKNRLFEAIVEQESLDHGKKAFNFDPALDAETSLRAFGRAYLEIVCRPDGGSAVRTVMAIAERMPDVGRRFYDRVIAHTMRLLAAYLTARVEAGELAIDDCELAAAQYRHECARRRCSSPTSFRPSLRRARNRSQRGRQRCGSFFAGYRAPKADLNQRSRMRDSSSMESRSSFDSGPFANMRFTRWPIEPVTPLSRSAYPRGAARAAISSPDTAAG